MSGGRAGRLRVVVLALEWPSPSRHAGGVGRYAKRLCEWLSCHVDLTVVTGPEPEPMEGDGRLVVVDTTRPGGRFARYYVAPLRAARVVDELAPDIVHSHGDDWPLVLRSRRHAPVVRTYHGRSAAEARSGPPLRRTNHVVLAGIEQICRSRYAAAVGTGPDSASAFRCERLIPPVLGLEADLAPAKDDVPLAMFIGGFSTRKRGELALRAVTEARRSVPGLRFAVVGPSTERDRYPAWVEFHDRLDDAAVRLLVRRSWVLIAPSTYEGFGIPVWEAMASGTPVLATPSPGIDFLANGGSCAVVADGSLGTELVELLRGDERRASQAAGGLARALEVARMGQPEQYLELYEKAAAR